MRPRRRAGEPVRAPRDRACGVRASPCVLDRGATFRIDPGNAVHERRSGDRPVRPGVRTGSRPRDSASTSIGRTRHGPQDHRALCGDRGDRCARPRPSRCRLARIGRGRERCHRRAFGRDRATRVHGVRPGFVVARSRASILLTRAAVVLPRRWSGGALAKAARSRFRATAANADPGRRPVRLERGPDQRRDPRHVGRGDPWAGDMERTAGRNCGRAGRGGVHTEQVAVNPAAVGGRKDQASDSHRPGDVVATAHPGGWGDPWMWVACLVPATAVLLSLMETEDLAYQVRAGSLMFQTHSVLRTDPFTFTVGGQPWHDLQWGAQLALAGVHAVAGWRGLVLVRAVIVGGAVGVTYLRTTRRGASPQASILATFAAFVVAASLPGSVAMRPQLLAVPLFLGAVAALDARSRRPSWMWAIPVIGVLWVNLHGSFVLLPLLCGMAFVADLIERAERRRTTGLVFLVSLITPLVDPWGYRSYSYVVDLATTPIIREVIDEWRPMWHQWPAGALFLLALIGVTILLARGGWSHLRSEERRVGSECRR